MDFFIIMKLGELLSLHKKAQFYIVSGDHDFDGVIKEYNRSGYNRPREQRNRTIQTDTYDKTERISI